MEWFAIENADQETTLLISAGEKELESSALHFTQEEMYASEQTACDGKTHGHVQNMAPSDGKTYVTVDLISQGIGNGSCYYWNAGWYSLQPQYWLKDRTYSYDFTILPVKTSTAAEYGRISRAGLPEEADLPVVSTVNVDVSAEATPTVNNGTASATVGNDTINSAIEEAKNNVGAVGSDVEVKIGNVTITAIATDSDTVTAAEVTLAKEAVATLSEAEKVTIKTNVGTVSLPQEVLKANTNTALTLVVEAKPESSITDAALTAKITAVFDVTVQNEQGQEVRISNLGTSIELSFNIGTGKGNVILAYVAGSTIKRIGSSSYDSTTGIITGKVKHLTEFVVVDPSAISDYYTITFDANGGTVSGSATQSVGIGSDGKLTSLPNATRSGYTFDGWYTEVNGGESVTTDTTFISDTTVYAHWTYNGGSGNQGGGNSGGSSSSHGGGGGSSVSKKVTVNSTKNGSVSISPSYPSKGNKVTLTVRPNSGYVLDTIKVLDSKGNEVEPVKDSDNK